MPYLEQTAEKSQVIKFHGDVFEANVKRDIGCLQEALGIDNQSSESLSVNADQSNIKVARRSTKPRAHSVTAGHLETVESQTNPNLSINIPQFFHFVASLFMQFVTFKSLRSVLT